MYIIIGNDCNICVYLETINFPQNSWQWEVKGKVILHLWDNIIIGSFGCKEPIFFRQIFGTKCEPFFWEASTVGSIAV